MTPITFPTTEFLAEYLRNRQPDVKWISGHNTYLDGETTFVQFRFDSFYSYGFIANCYSIDFLKTQDCYIEFDNEEQCEVFCMAHNIEFHDGAFVRFYGDGSAFNSDYARDNFPLVNIFSVIQ